jgi:agmatine deiminase
VTPKSQGFVMPAEWAPHEAIWLSWPHDPESFGPGLPKVEDSYVRVIKEIHASERVELLVTGKAMRAKVEKKLSAAKVDAARVRFHEFPYADVWIRDYGPTFVTKRGSLGAVRWIFNAWGGKYKELMGDTKAPDVILRNFQGTVFVPGVVMEGGSIEVDGAGTVLTTEQCLLNKNRNPKLSRADVEKVLCDNLGVSRVVWLKEGVAGDDTDGHIDDIARFYAPNKVVCAVEANKSDENYGPLKECLEACEKNFDDVLELPMPAPVEADGRRLPASYANYYVGNGVILAPVFGVKQDDKALAVIEKAYPGRRIAPIPCREWVRGLGTVHCGSQQQPAV